MISLAAVLDAVAVPHDALPCLWRAAGALPAGLTDTIYFEHWMRRTPRVDMICRVTRAHRALLTTAGQGRWLAKSSMAHSAWRHVASFVDAWSATDAPLDRAVDHIWLEFDLPVLQSEGAEALPPPGVFADFAPAVYLSEDVPTRVTAADLVLRTLVPTIGADVLALLRVAITELPTGAAMPYIGVLLPRGSDVVRVCVDGLDTDATEGYLRDIGWRGDATPLSRALGAWCAGDVMCPSRSLLHVDLSTRPSRNLAIELKCARAPQVHGRLAEADFLRALVTRGAMTDALRAQLVAWPGAMVRTLPHQFWTSLVLRRLNHLKLVLDEDGFVLGKAYLSLAHRHFRRVSPRLAAPSDAFI